MEDSDFSRYWSGGEGWGMGSFGSCCIEVTRERGCRENVEEREEGINEPDFFVSDEGEGGDGVEDCYGEEELDGGARRGFVKSDESKGQVGGCK